jgi:hypothetical protein
MATAVPPALRRLPRPPRVETCRACGLVLGGGYATCTACRTAVDRHWLADWEAAVADAGLENGAEAEALVAELALAEPERWPWSVLDIGMTRLTCPGCGGELGGGPPACRPCADALGAALWSEWWAGQQGLVTANEHALHIGRFVVRHPHRYPPDSVTGWRLTMPRLLTGWLPTTAEAQRGAALIKQGRMAEITQWLAAVDAAIERGGR